LWLHVTVATVCGVLAVLLWLGGALGDAFARDPVLTVALLLACAALLAVLAWGRGHVVHLSRDVVDLGFMGRVLERGVTIAGVLLAVLLPAVGAVLAVALVLALGAVLVLGLRLMPRGRAARPASRGARVFADVVAHLAPLPLVGPWLRRAIDALVRGFERRHG
jgi:hypothetical protein